MFDTLRKCLRMVPPETRWWWILVPLMAMVSGVVEGGAAAAVFGLVKIVNDPGDAARLPIASSIVPFLPSQEPSALILQFTALVALYYITKNLLMVGMQYFRHKVFGESSAILACAMLRGYLLAPYPFHFRRNSAELIRNTTHSVSAVFGVLESATSVLSELLVGAGIVTVLLVTSPGVTLVAGLALVVLVTVLLTLTRRMAERSGREEHRLGKTILQTLQHALGGIKEIKALGREEFFYRAFAEQQRAKLALGYLGITMGALPQLVIETCFICGALLVIAIVTVSGKAGPHGLPLLGLFAYAGFRMVPMANRVSWRLNVMRSRRLSVSELYADYLLVTRQDESSPDDAADGTGFRDRIVLDGVSYTYPGSDAPAVHGVDLTICRGESIGIVGASGAGKSTLIDLIVGLLAPTEGRITIDGIDMPGPSQAWRRHIGYVPQSIFLLDDTVRRNVALGIPDAEIDDRRVREAIGMAQLDGVIASLPAGLDTLIGERGVRFSGGERQRVGIARALYHNPDIVVFDEATSALDHATEAELTRAIDSLRGRKTMLIIAHRLSTVRNCDRVVLLAGGRVIDCGTFDELVRRNPELRRLVVLDAPRALQPAREAGTKMH